MSQATAGHFDGGSFRDRQGRVYQVDGRIIRGLKASSLAHFEALGKTTFYQRQLEAGSIVSSRRLAAEEVPLEAGQRAAWDGFLEHDRVAVISYPYEWTASMLQAAALLQLNLLEEALAEDFTIKDATPYNIQFVGGRPVFIDIPSFEPLPAGKPWTGYRQFCELFLFPLLLQCYKGIDFQPLLRARIDGVDLQQANRLFGFRDRFRKGVASHVWLQSKLDARFSSTSREVKSDLKAAGFNKELILANVRKLKKLVGSLEWSHGRTEWGNYADTHNYTEADHEQKAGFVDQCLAGKTRGLLWDMGSNQGQFSRVASRNCEQVLALDVDHPSLDRLFQEPDRPQNILPLLQNVLDPSPDWGWRLRERRDLVSRAQPDVILALAVIHHVVISGHVPLDDFIAWLAEITPELIIEFVDRSDDKVQTLLRNKDDDYADYDLEPFETALKRHFSVESRLTLGAGKRHLYHARRPAKGGQA